MQKQKSWQNIFIVFFAEKVKGYKRLFPVVQGQKLEVVDSQWVVSKERTQSTTGCCNDICMHWQQNSCQWTVLVHDGVTTVFVWLHKSPDSLVCPLDRETADLFYTWTTGPAALLLLLHFTVTYSHKEAC